MAEGGCCCCEGAGGIGRGCLGDRTTCNVCVLQATVGGDEGTGFKAVGCLTLGFISPWLSGSVVGWPVRAPVVVSIG